MYSAWTNHIKDPEEKSQFLNTVLSSKPVFERLRAILKDADDAAGRAEININIFDTPNWAYKQAYMNGYRACTQVLDKLINLDQQRNKQ